LSSNKSRFKVPLELMCILHNWCMWTFYNFYFIKPAHVYMLFLLI